MISNKTIDELIVEIDNFKIYVKQYADIIEHDVIAQNSIQENIDEIADDLARRQMACK